MTRVRFKVKFGGMATHQIAGWVTTGQLGFLDFDQDKVRIADKLLPMSAPFADESPAGGSDREPNNQVVSLHDLRFIAYESAGTTSNVGALAAFGPLGLGARKSWTLMTIGFSDSDAQFLIRSPVHQVRTLLSQASTCSATLDSLVVEGPPPGIRSVETKLNEKRTPSPVDEVERLARLYKEGLLTADEFAAMKSKILDNL